MHEYGRPDELLPHITGYWLAGTHEIGGPRWHCKSVAQHSDPHAMKPMQQPLQTGAEDAWASCATGTQLPPAASPAIPPSGGGGDGGAQNDSLENVRHTCPLGHTVDVVQGSAHQHPFVPA